MLHSPRGSGAVLLIAMFSALPIPGALIAQNSGASGAAVNRDLRLDMSLFRPFEIQYETEADDGRQLVVTTSYRLDSASGAEPLIRRRQEEEYFDWREGFPRKTRYYVVESVARASDLHPVSTEAVNQYWNDESAAWVSQRVTTTFSPGHVSSRWDLPGDTSLNELALPDGILQGEMASLVLGMSADPPRGLELTFYNWVDNEIATTRYDALGRDTVTTAGRTFEAILIEGTDPATAAVVSRNYYRAAIPRFFVRTAGAEDALFVSRIRVGE